MNNNTVNLTISEAYPNTTAHPIVLLNPLETSLLSINFLFGLPTHSYVIWLIVTGNRIASEFFSLNLSVCEIGVCLNCMFTILAVWFSSFETLALFSSGLGITGRPLFQCLICVERYLAVVHPVTFLKYRPLRYRAVCSTSAWIIILGFCFICMFILVSLRVYVYMWFFSVPFLIFFSIKLFCCVAVLRALKQSGPGERGREREEENHMKKRAFHLILITTVTMVVIYLPFTLSGFIAIFTNCFITALWSLGLMFYVLTAFVQPVLYLHRNGKLFTLKPSNRS